MKKCGKATCAQSSRVLFYNTVKPRLLQHQNSIYFLALFGKMPDNNEFFHFCIKIQFLK